MSGNEPTELDDFIWSESDESVVSGSSSQSEPSEGDSGDAGDLRDAAANDATDGARIPKSRLDKEIKKRKALESSLAEKEKELERALSERESLAGQEELSRIKRGEGLPEEFDEWSMAEQQAWLAEKVVDAKLATAKKGDKSDPEVKALREEIERMRFEREMPFPLDAAQQSYLLNLRKKTGLSDPEELMFLASRHKPEMFKAVSGGAGSPAHFVQGAGFGGRQEDGADGVKGARKAFLESPEVDNAMTGAAYISQLLRQEE